MGRREDWRQPVLVRASGSDPDAFQITPKNGKVTIAYRDAAGLLHTWNGTVFVQQATLIELATTIEGKDSVYVFTVPEEARDYTLVFTGWVNGDRNTINVREVFVGPESPDIEQDAAIDPEP